MSVLVSSTCIRLALVPDGAANAVADNRSKHALIEVARSMLALELPGILWTIPLFDGHPAIYERRILLIGFEQLARNPRFAT